MDQDLKVPCSDDPELFHPESDAGPRQLKEARGVCAGCPVMEGCLKMGLEPIRLMDGRSELPSGIWGGFNLEQRMAMTRGRKLTTKPLCGTEPGYKWHLRRNEQCPRCMEAGRVADLRRRTRRAIS